MSLKSILCTKISMIGMICTISFSAEKNMISKCDNSFDGCAVHHASIKGKACIIHKRKELIKISAGDIIVAPAIHQSWRDKLQNIKGIITEKKDENGNDAILLGTILNIPVIVGIDGATKKIRDGELITINPTTRNFELEKLYIFHDQKTKEDHSIIHNTYTIRSNSTLSDYKNDSKCSIENIKDFDGDKKNKKKKISKEIVACHLKEFKSYVLSMRSKLNTTKSWLGEWGLLKGAKAAGCDTFAVDCIPLSFSFFEKNEDYIVTVLESINNDTYIPYIERIIQKCSSKPDDLNWVARIAHEEHIEAIPLSPELEDSRNKLKEDPKEYRKIETKVDKDKREAYIAAGLFARYCVEILKLKI